MSDLSFEIAEQKLQLLATVLPEHHTELEQAKNYLRNDPNAVMMKLRLVLEALVSEVWEHHNKNATTGSLAEMMNNASFKQVVERRVHSRMNSLRITGNLAVHSKDVNSSDALSSVDHLFEIVNWYLPRFKNKPQLPEPSDQPHPLTRFLKDSLKDVVFLFVMAANWLFTLLICRFAEIFPVFKGTPISKVYEGLFKAGMTVRGVRVSGTLFSFSYSLTIVLLSFIAAWLIFKRFRRQNLTSRIVAFQLMFTFFFALQLLFLIFTDPFVNIF